MRGVGLVGLGQPNSLPHPASRDSNSTTVAQGEHGCPGASQSPTTVLDSGALDDAEPLMFQKIPHDVQPVSFLPS